jgi:modulator of FtsH protease
MPLAVNSGLQPALWHDLFIAFASACAALLGLLFVALSLHPDEVERHPLEFYRAKSGLLALAGGLTLSLLALIPSQPLALLGAEMIAVEVGLLIAARDGLRVFRELGAQAPRITRLTRFVNGLVILLVVVGGISLIVGRGPGLFLVAPAVVVIGPMSSYFAWSVLFATVRRA